MIELLPLIAAVLLMQATPGPNMVAVSSIALGSGRRAGMTTAAGVRPSGRRAYLTGLLVVLTNPKAAPMWVAVSMLLVSVELTSAQFLLVGLCCSLSAVAVYGHYALAFSTGAATRAYRRLFRAVEVAFGTNFGVLGTRLVVDGMREIRN